MSSCVTDGRLHFLQTGFYAAQKYVKKMKLGFHKIIFVYVVVVVVLF